MKIHLAIVPPLLSLSASGLSAQTIYDDTFTRMGEVYNSTPAPIDETGAKYTGAGSNGYTANGTAAIDSIGGGILSQDLSLPAGLPTTGFLTVSAGLMATDMTNGWSAVGFGIFSPGSGPWMLVDSDGSYQTFTSGTSGASQTTPPPVTLTPTSNGNILTTFATAAVQLNLSTDVADYLVDGTTVATGTFGLSTITEASFGGYSTDSTVSDFDVTYSATLPAPEPSSYAVLGLGVAALILTARSRRSVSL